MLPLNSYEISLNFHSLVFKCRILKLRINSSNQINISENYVSQLSNILLLSTISLTLVFWKRISLFSWMSYFLIHITIEILLTSNILQQKILECPMHVLSSLPLNAFNNSYVWLSLFTFFKNAMIKANFISKVRMAFFSLRKFSIRRFFYLRR